MCKVWSDDQDFQTDLLLCLRDPEKAQFTQPHCMLFPRNEKIVGIRLSSHPVVMLFSCYLPTRYGGTDPFKSVMDELDSCVTFYPGDVLLFASDFTPHFMDEGSI